jgi:hypothetical protein
LGRRGPGTGLRQAGTVAEAGQWLQLVDALGSAHAAPLLPHLSLRATDAPALRDVCPRAAASLRRILAETQDSDPLADVNGVLAALYGELESRWGARPARSLFALASDGFPDEAALHLMARWEGPLQQILRDFRSSGLPESKRDVVTAMVAHHVAGLEVVHAAVPARGAGAEDAARIDWLLSLVHWRRFASLGRALARVLTAGEREHLAAFTRTLRAS